MIELGCLEDRWRKIVQLDEKKEDDDEKFEFVAMSEEELENAYVQEEFRKLIPNEDYSPCGRLGDHEMVETTAVDVSQDSESEEGEGDEEEENSRASTAERLTDNENNDDEKNEKNDKDSSD